MREPDAHSLLAYCRPADPCLVFRSEGEGQIIDTTAAPPTATAMLHDERRAPPSPELTVGE